MKSRHAEPPEKLRGAYFTPAGVAEYLCRWALAAGPARVLEPCCGDGAFLRALAATAGPAGPGNRVARVVDAVEIDPRSAAQARALAPSLRDAESVLDVSAADFFAWLEAQPESARWEAVVGNPPYVRYQYLDAAARDRAAALCARAGVTLSRRTNAWVPFVIAAASRLSPGGRLAMVVPAEILHVIHADGLRRMLEREMSAVTVLHLRGMVFPGVLQGVVLLLAVRRRARAMAGAASRRGRPTEDDDGAAGLARLRVLDVRDEASLPAPESLGSLGVGGAEGAAGAAWAGGQWTRALLRPEESLALARAERAPWARRFTDLARVDIGMVTGANAFFLADGATVKRYGLRSVARPAFGRSEQARGVVYGREDHRDNARGGKSVFFLAFPARKTRAALPSGMRAYLARGEAEGLDRRYKCRIREPWWAVPSVWAAPVAMLKRCHGYPRLLLNTAGALSTDTAYRVRLAGEGEGRGADLVFSFVNTLTFLLAEIEGRSYGGGVLEMVPSEIERLRIPMASVPPARLAELDAMVRAGAAAETVLDYTDPILLGRKGAGLSREEIATLRGAWRRLRDRRLRV